MNLKDITFWGVNIPKETKQILDTFKESVTSKMNKDEKLAYQCGIENALSALKVVLEVSDDEPAVVFHSEECKMPTEFIIEDLIKLLKTE